MKEEETQWGVRYFKKYVPRVDISSKEVKSEVDRVELRIEVSGPRIKEYDSHHYFEFSLTQTDEKEIHYHHSYDGSVMVRVPPVEHLAAVKLGLPVDYKNNIDSAVLLQTADIDETIDVIRNNDDWKEMVLRRVPRSIGRIRDKNRFENIIAVDKGIDIRDYVRKLRYIQERLRDKV